MPRVLTVEENNAARRRRSGESRVRKNGSKSSWDSGSRKDVCTSFLEVTKGLWSTGGFEALDWLTTTGTRSFWVLAVNVSGSQWTAAKPRKCKFTLFFFASDSHWVGAMSLCLLPAAFEYPRGIVDHSPQYSGTSAVCSQPAAVSQRPDSM